MRGDVKGSMTRVGEEPEFLSRLVSQPTPGQERNAVVHQPAVLSSSNITFFNWGSDQKPA